MILEVDLPKAQIKRLDGAQPSAETIDIACAQTIQYLDGDRVAVRSNQAARRSAPIVSRFAGDCESGGEFGDLGHIQGHRNGCAVEAKGEKSFGIIPGPVDDLELHAVGGVAKSIISVEIGDSGEHPRCGVEGGGVGQQEAMILAAVNSIDGDLPVVAGDLGPSIVCTKLCDQTSPPADNAQETRIAESTADAPPPQEGCA